MAETFQLIRPTEVAKRVRVLASSFEKIYGDMVDVRRTSVEPSSLLATEEYLERTKLGLVLRAATMEGYYAPIIVLSERDLTYILDGHHRAYVYWLLGYMFVDAYMLRLKHVSHTRREAFRLWEMRLYQDEMPKSPRARLWRFTAGVIHFFVARYKGAFRLRTSVCRLDELVPTQSLVESESVENVERLGVLDEPILCLEYRGKKYIVDGHARAMNMLLKGCESVNALILYPTTENIKIGLIEASEKMGLRSLSDVEIA
ncbi:MAG: hypothetical protein DRJ46_02275 [Thermoprotei archaeon]|nr:MAG: hypothetical protein DRJ46_02275 [Thermoprotei archaeon]